MRKSTMVLMIAALFVCGLAMAEEAEKPAKKAAKAEPASAATPVETSSETCSGETPVETIVDLDVGIVKRWLGKPGSR